MTWDRNHVFRTKDGSLFQDLAPYRCQREPIARGIVVLIATGILDRLKGNAAHTGLLEGKIDDFADFGIVESFFDRNDKGSRDAVRVQAVDGALANRSQIGAAKLHERFALKGIKLQVKLEVRHVAGEAADEFLVLSDPDSVGIHHEMSDRALLRQVQDAEEIGMHAGLAT